MGWYTDENGNQQWYEDPVAASPAPVATAPAPLSPPAANTGMTPELSSTYGPAWNLMVITPAQYAQKIQQLIAYGMSPQQAQQSVDAIYTTSEAGRAAAISQYMTQNGQAVPDYVTRVAGGEAPVSGSNTFAGYLGAGTGIGADGKFDIIPAAINFPGTGAGLEKYFINNPASSSNTGPVGTTGFGGSGLSSGGATRSWTPDAQPTGTSTNNNFDLLMNGGPEMASLGTQNNLNLEDQYDQYTSYLNKLGIGTKDYWNPYQKWQEQQFQPLSNMYNVYQRLSQPTSPFAGRFSPFGSFADYASPSISDPSARYSQAAQMLNAIFGATPDQRAEANSTYEPFQTVDSLGLASGKMDDNNIGELQQLIALAARQKYGNVGARWMANNVGRDQQRWTSLNAAGQDNGTFLDYLRNRYNLQTF